MSLNARSVLTQYGQKHIKKGQNKMDINTNPRQMKTFSGAINLPPEIPIRKMTPGIMDQVRKMVNRPGYVQLPHELLVSLIVCLIQDKGESSDLGQAFTQLCAERHNHFHEPRHGYEETVVDGQVVYGTDRVRLPAITWRECTSAVCVEARRLMDRLQMGEVMVNQFGLQRAIAKAIDVTVTAGMIKITVVDPKNTGPKIEVVPA